MKLSDIIIPIKASAYAGYAHRGQTRKFSGDKYVKHPRRVTGRLKKFGITEPDVLAAALLHDSIEDTSVSYADIKKHFGKKVADLVKWLSNPSDIPKAGHIRKLVYNAPYEVVVIKTFDRIDNLNDNPNPKFLKRYRETTDIIKDGLQDRGFTKLYNEFMKTYRKRYGES